MLAAATAARFDILPAHSGPALQAVRDLFLEYARSLHIDLCFQNFEAELAALPGDYAPPAGRLLLAQVDGQAAACIGLRALQHDQHPQACEMKRLYVRPAFRGHGLALRLVQQLMSEARSQAYACMLLDTLDEMQAARALYARVGFTEIAPYCFNPIAGAHYLKATL